MKRDTLLETKRLLLTIWRRTTATAALFAGLFTLIAVAQYLSVRHCLFALAQSQADTWAATVWWTTAYDAKSRREELASGLALETALHFARLRQVGDLGDQRLAVRLRHGDEASGGRDVGFEMIDAGHAGNERGYR